MVVPKLELQQNIETVMGDIIHFYNHFNKRLNGLNSFEFRIQAA